MLCCLYFIPFSLHHTAPFWVGFVCLFGWWGFFPHRSTDPLEAIWKGILSEHVKFSLLLRMCLYVGYNKFQEPKYGLLNPHLESRAHTLPAALCRRVQHVECSSALQQLGVPRYWESQTHLQLIEFRGLLWHKLYLVSKGAIPYFIQICQMKSSSQPGLSTYISNVLDQQQPKKKNSRTYSQGLDEELRS